MLNTIAFFRRQLSVVVGLLFIVGFASFASAEAPQRNTQAPGFYRMRLGEFEVTALFDGIVDLNSGLLLNIKPEESQELLKKAMVDDPQKIPTSINAYLINTGAKLVLVDTGAGAAFGPSSGLLVKNLKESGYEPEQIDAVLITHLHPDHMAGMANAEGKPKFPNALIYVAKAESDYWLSEAEPTNVPDGYKAHMKQARKMVRDAAEPFIKAEKWKTFEGNSLPFDGITATAIAGHTPGHTAYEIESDGKKLVIFGDMIHLGAVQFARPDAAMTFDVDPKLAVETREASFKKWVDGKTFVAGMHVAFPGIGRLRAEEGSGYSWIPVEYGPIKAEEKLRDGK